MSDWFYVDRGTSSFYEVAGYTDEPFHIYRSRFLEPSSPTRVDDAIRYCDNLLSGLYGSLLVVGSGHPDHCNTFLNYCPGLLSITATDVVIEASYNLDPSITFIQADLLEDDLVGKYDYVFSAHTLEHFNEYNLFNVVWPKLEKAAISSIITVVPFMDAWKDEPSHKCRFGATDRFAGMQNRYKYMLDGKEIAFWKDM